MKVVFASNNPGKVLELQALFNEAHLNWDVIPQSKFNVSDIAETGLTFVENALLKARHASRHTGLPAIADDSGLEVIALKGAPGIYSARYAGNNATANDNMAKLLDKLHSIPKENRQAAFQCALVYLRHPEDPTPIICQGTWHGFILDNPRGQDGFGYDPLFFDPKENCTAAELSLDIKNKISHRGKAFHALLEKIAQEKDWYASTFG